jgi:hypothetical protein
VKTGSISQLAENLTNLFDAISADEIDLKKAAELNNTAGKVLKVYQVQLAYHALRGESPDIAFLAAPSVRPTKGAPLVLAVDVDKPPPPPKPIKANGRRSASAKLN